MFCAPATRNAWKFVFRKNGRVSLAPSAGTLNLNVPMIQSIGPNKAKTQDGFS